jgi:hypothetical protein
MNTSDISVEAKTWSCKAVELTLRVPPGPNRRGGENFLANQCHYKVLAEKTTKHHGEDKAYYLLAGSFGPFFHVFWAHYYKDDSPHMWPTSYLRADVEGTVRNLGVGEWCTAAEYASEPVMNVEYRAPNSGNIWHIHITESGLREVLKHRGVESEWEFRSGSNAFTVQATNPVPKLLRSDIYPTVSGEWGVRVCWTHDDRLHVSYISDFEHFIGFFKTKRDAQEAVHKFEVVGQIFVGKLRSAREVWAKAQSLHALELLALEGG